MKILFLSPYLPWPTTMGGKNRVAGLLRALRTFASVDVLAIGDSNGDDAATSRAEMAALGGSIAGHLAEGPQGAHARNLLARGTPDAIAHFTSPTLSAELRHRLRCATYDLVWIEELALAPYASEIRATEGAARNVPVVLSRQKIEWALAAEDHATRWREFERNTCILFDAFVVTGNKDAELVTNASSQSSGRVAIAPISVSPRLRHPPNRTTLVDHVLLYGNLDYAPTAEANRRFLREIWPELRNRFPHIRADVLGAGNAAGDSLDNSDARVRTLGYVPDVLPHLVAPGVLVAPITTGGGARTKILEAMACGMPVVSTGAGLENIDAEPGRHVLTAETNNEFVETTSRLIIAGGGRIGEEAAHFIDEKHRDTSVIAALQPFLTDLVANKSGSSSVSTGPRRALILGVGPLPSDARSRSHTFPGHRTAQFAAAARAAGYEVVVVLRDEGVTPGFQDPDIPRIEALAPGTFADTRTVERLVKDLNPSVVMTAGGYHAARLAVALNVPLPLLIDIAGDFGAEAALHPPGTHDGVIVLRAALEKAAAFSVASDAQSLAVLGQLSLVERLPRSLSPVPVLVVPPTSFASAHDRPFLRPHTFRSSHVILLSSGSINAWSDALTLAESLEALWREPEAREFKFVSTGAPVTDDPTSEAVYREFQGRLDPARREGRAQDYGSIAASDLDTIWNTAHVALCLSRNCPEARLGSRQRVVEALARGRPVVVTKLGDIADVVAIAGAGVAVPPNDPDAVVRAIKMLTRDDETLAAAGRAARQLFETRFAMAPSTFELCAWLKDPTAFATLPAGSVDSAIVGLIDQNARLQYELNAVRGSTTFKALRAFDRLTGRSARKS